MSQLSRARFEIELRHILCQLVSSALLCFSSLRRHVQAINKLAKAGMHFWDYGNAFLLEAKNIGADIVKPGLQASRASTTDFRYPSYVQHIMGYVSKHLLYT